MNHNSDCVSVPDGNSLGLPPESTHYHSSEKVEHAKKPKAASATGSGLGSQLQGSVRPARYITKGSHADHMRRLLVLYEETVLSNIQR